MKKSFCLLLMVCLLILGTNTVFAAYDDGTYTYIISNGEATVTGVVSKSDFEGAQTIPKELGGCPVTTIGDRAFSYCGSLTSISIPNSVTAIGLGAFGGCQSLTSINIPNSVTAIGDYTFNICSSLKSISIPNSVTTIGEGAFNGCGSLTSIDIPDSVTTIEDGAFYYCSSLTSVSIPNSVTTIGNSAFFGCSLTNISIPDSVTTIGKGAFSYCGLKNINVAADNKYYTDIDGNLYNKEKTTIIQYAIGKTNSSFVIPDSVMTIGDSAFAYCDSLTSISIPNSVTTIGDSTFGGCQSLTSISIPNSVTTIGYWAFSGCQSLKSISIPNSVTTIGYWAFYYCSNLKNVYYAGTASDWQKISISSGNDDLVNANIIYNHREYKFKTNGYDFYVESPNTFNGIFIVVGYSSDGRLKEITRTALNENASEYLVSDNIKINSETSYYKYFLWDEANFIPLCEAQEIIFDN